MAKLKNFAVLMGLSLSAYAPAQTTDPRTTVPSSATPSRGSSVAEGKAQRLPQDINPADQQKLKKLADATSAIVAYEKRHPRKYLSGDVKDMMTLPDGSIAYLIYGSAMTHERLDGDQWFIATHPVEGTITPRRQGELPTGHSGTTFYGYGWFLKDLPDAFQAAGQAHPAALYDSQPAQEMRPAYEQREHLKTELRDDDIDPETGEFMPDYRVSGVLLSAFPYSHSINIHFRPDLAVTMCETDYDCSLMVNEDNKKAIGSGTLADWQRAAKAGQRLRIAFYRCTFEGHDNWACAWTIERQE